MIKFENTEVAGWEHAIRGMRNPLNSWDKSDSFYGCCKGDYGRTESHYCNKRCKGDCHFVIGEQDLNLMKRLRKAGTDHRKYLRMINVYVDITAPLYWWKEFDTYKVGTVANSCSTMHKIQSKEFTLADFSFEHLETMSRFFDEDVETQEYHYKPYMLMKEIIYCLEACRQTYLRTGDKTDWWQMIQLLPSSYNQKRTVMINYETLNNVYKSRQNHKLDEWSVGFMDWIKSLPYAKELIIGEE